MKLCAFYLVHLLKTVNKLLSSIYAYYLTPILSSLTSACLYTRTETVVADGATVAVVVAAATAVVVVAATVKVAVAAAAAATSAAVAAATHVFNPV